jgi:hypothetical protein
MNSQWHTACAYYYAEPGKDDLILDAVRPLFGELVAPAYFLRHWRRGPHLRLNVLATPRTWRDTVLPAIESAIGGFTARRPSTSTVDPMSLLANHRGLAEAEREPGPVWPWRPDNSVHEEPYDSRAEVLGGAEAAAVVADFYLSANRAAFGALDAVRAGAGRLWTAFDLMLATAHTFAAGGVRSGYVSFRAHAEVFLAGDPAREPLRAAWDEHYAGAAPFLRDRLASAVDGAPSAPVRDWLAAVRAVSERGFTLVDAGGMRMDRAPSGREAPPGVTPFLRELITNQDFHHRLMPSAAFGRYRLLLNLLYLQLTRLGVRPVERFLLCHLIANTVEESYGLDAVTALRANAAMGSGHG